MAAYTTDYTASRLRSLTTCVSRGMLHHCVNLPACLTPLPNEAIRDPKPSHGGTMRLTRVVRASVVEAREAGVMVELGNGEPGFIRRRDLPRLARRDPGILSGTVVEGLVVDRCAELG